MANISWLKPCKRGIEDIYIYLMYDLCEWGSTLLTGLLKKLSQFYAWSNASGKKMRLGLSRDVDLMWTPLSLTFLLSTSWGSELAIGYFPECGRWWRMDKDLWFWQLSSFSYLFRYINSLWNQNIKQSTHFLRIWIRKNSFKNEMVSNDAQFVIYNFKNIIISSI